MIKYKGLRIIIAFMLITCFALIVCSDDDADSPDALVPSVMIDDVV